MAHKKQKSIAKKPVQKLKLWHFLLLIVIPAAIYGRTIFFDFVMHDDDKMVLENSLLKEGLDVPLAFSTDAWFMKAGIELYRPWQSISYMTDYSIGKMNPAVYHMHNLLIFILGVVLLFYFLQFYFKPILAWAGALLYGMNLLTPHIAVWIAARGDLYLMVFGLIFLILIQQFLKSGSAKSLWLAVPAFLMAQLSKESAIALLPVGLVMIYVDKKKMPGLMVWVWAALNALLFAGYYALRKQAISEAGNLSVSAFFSNLRSLAEEFFKMIIPMGFSVMPGYSIIWTLAGIILFGVIGYLVWKYKPDHKILITGLAIWLMLLLPSLAYEPSFAGVAYDYLDHRTWLPFVGLWLLVLGVADKLKLINNGSAATLFGSVLVLWASINLWQSGVYQKWDTYYANAILTNPGSGLANLNYGSLLKNKKDWEASLPYLQKGVQLSPDYNEGKVRLAEAYFNLKKYNEAIEILNVVLTKEPLNIPALQFRGSSYGVSGQTNEALKDFKKILEAEPDNKNGLFNLGVAYKEANLLNQAIESYSRLISLQPDFPYAYFERGYCYGEMGLYQQAKRDMDASIGYQPDYGSTYYFRGRYYEALGDIKSACADWNKALEMGIKAAEEYVFEKCSQK